MSQWIVFEHNVTGWSRHQLCAFVRNQHSGLILIMTYDLEIQNLKDALAASEKNADRYARLSTISFIRSAG